MFVTSILQLSMKDCPGLLLGLRATVSRVGQSPYKTLGYTHMKFLRQFVQSLVPMIPYNVCSNSITIEAGPHFNFSRSTFEARAMVDYVYEGPLKSHPRQHFVCSREKNK